MTHRVACLGSSACGISLSPNRLKLFVTGIVYSWPDCQSSESLLRSHHLIHPRFLLNSRPHQCHLYTNIARLIAPIVDHPNKSLLTITSSDSLSLLPEPLSSTSMSFLHQNGFGSGKMEEIGVRKYGAREILVNLNILAARIVCKTLYMLFWRV